MSKEEENNLELTYTGIFVNNKNHIVLPTIVDEFADDNRDHALVYHRIDNEWVQHLIENSICGVTAINIPSTKVFNVGIDGYVIIASIPGGESTEIVDSSENGPNYSETLRCVRIIGGKIFTAGMARQVYKREKNGVWNRLDKGVYVPRGQRSSAVGFLDIGGFSEKDIYAVGYKGEIWHFNGSSWHQEDSPTNIALTCVVCDDSANIFIAGMSGTVIWGRKGGWQVIDNDITEEDFWGISFFKKNIYLSNYDGIYCIFGDSLKKIDMGLNKVITTAYLHSDHEVLWSVGQKDIVMTVDGRKWTIVDNP